MVNRVPAACPYSVVEPVIVPDLADPAAPKLPRKLSLAGTRTQLHLSVFDKN